MAVCGKSLSRPCVLRLVVAGLEDALLLGAGEHLGGVVAAESLAQPRDAGQDFLRKHERLVDEIELAEAHVAGAAVFAVELLAKVLDQRAMAAGRCRSRTRPSRSSASRRRPPHRARLFR